MCIISSSYILQAFLFASYINYDKAWHYRAELQQYATFGNSMLSCFAIIQIVYVFLVSEHHFTYKFNRPIIDKWERMNQSHSIFHYRFSLLLIKCRAGLSAGPCSKHYTNGVSVIRPATADYQRRHGLNLLCRQIGFNSILRIRFDVDIEIGRYHSTGARLRHYVKISSF